jgi:putative ABC transport system permease protein
VDDVDVWKGRWATAPGEIVLNVLPSSGGPDDMFAEGMEIEVPGGETLTVVGYAYSLSETAGAWVSPEQMESLDPTAVQMLYRFTDHETNADIRIAMDSLAIELPPDALIASQSYLTVKESIAAGPGSYLVFLIVFGVLGLVVAVLIVANVVSGAVVSGFRHIGILKSLGFTPRQVVGVYLLMVSVPAVIATAVGTVLGHLAAQPMLSQAFQGAGLGNVTVSPWVDLGALVGMPAIVIVAALAPALRAHRLSAIEAISAGSATHTGRGLRVQRRLSGTRLPRSISLGLGLPFTRPGRSALTMAAVALGVMTATFATGLVATVTDLEAVTDRSDYVEAVVETGHAEVGRTETGLDYAEVQDLLGNLSGTSNVNAALSMPLSAVGITQGVDVRFLRGDHSAMGFQDQLVEGRWLEQPGEAVVTSQLMRQSGVEVGDSLTLQLDEKQVEVTVIGAIIGTGYGGAYADWGDLAALAPDFEELEDRIRYEVQLAPGTSADEYAAAVTAADPALHTVTDDDASSYTLAITSLATVLALMLATVAALGVFNTVVLNTLERRRVLGMLKSIGMTPRQVVAMMVASMSVLGTVGGLLGLGLGILAHRQVLPLAADAAQVDIPDSLLQVWTAPVLGALAFAGLLIAVLGALIPARAAARLTIAEVLHTE